MPTYLTPAGITKLKKELEQLNKQKRSLSQDISVAREHGDLKENAEYHAAKERLGQLMEKLNSIQMKLADVQVVDPKQRKTDAAVLGTKVKVKDLNAKREETYILVTPDESVPSEGRISIESPLGRAFLGHKVKEKVTVELPSGACPYQILSIESAE